MSTRRVLLAILLFACAGPGRVTAPPPRAEEPDAAAEAPPAAIRDAGLALLRDFRIIPIRKIRFKTDSPIIKPESFTVLDVVAEILRDNPQFQLVEVQAHSDERPPDDYNIRLTRSRAAAVVDALVARGIDRIRLRSAGYGERCPVDPRHNQRAWERNRRIELVIIKTDAGPTGVEIACPAGSSLIPP